MLLKVKVLYVIKKSRIINGIKGSVQESELLSGISIKTMKKMDRQMAIKGNTYIHTYKLAQYGEKTVIMGY